MSGHPTIVTAQQLAEILQIHVDTIYRHTRTQKAAEQAERRGVDERERGLLPADLRRSVGDFLGEWGTAARPSVRAQTWASFETHVRL